MTFSVMWVQNHDGAVSIDDQPVLTSTSEMGFMPMLRGSVIVTDTTRDLPGIRQLIHTDAEQLVDALEATRRLAPLPVWVLGTADLLDAATRHPGCAKIVVCSTTGRTRDADVARVITVPHGFCRFASSNLLDQHMVLSTWTRKD